MKTFKVPVLWQSWGIMEIEAPTLEEAKKKALGDQPLPEGNYVDGSIQIDTLSNLYDELLKQDEEVAEEA